MKIAPEAGQDGRAGQVGRASEEQPSLIKAVERYLTDYIALPPYTATVIAVWIVAAWMANVWDRFPHLSIYSPEKRCGKTRLLEVLKLIVPNPVSTSSISPAALYRVIESYKKVRPTIILDEAQFLSRAKSESGEVIKELLNAGIEKDAMVVRCGGKRMEEICKFHTYSPKIFAQIGEPEGVLADRSLLIEMKRKTEQDIVERFRLSEVQPRAKALKKRLVRWAKEYEESATVVYSIIEPLDIENDRMADLLMPLQTILDLEGDSPDILSAYAARLDERDRMQESQSWGVKLLTACREIFETEGDNAFIPTSTLIDRLVSRDEEIWSRWNRGEGMNPEALGKLLRPYDIRPAPNKARSQRGYYVHDFQDTFQRYLAPAPLEKPSSPSRSSRKSKG